MNWLEEEMEKLKHDEHFIREGIVIDIGEIIAKRMTELEIDKSFLADKLGVEEEFVRGILIGTSDYTITFLSKLMSILKTGIRIKGA